MSSDTARENASVVDSSVTEWKNDMGNSDDLENEDGYPFKAQDLEHSHVADKRGKLCNKRYFIIKSLNHQNIQLSIDKGIWATQVMNEPILEDAFHNSGCVILIFSVNMSGFFQGYAQMMSSVGWRRDNVWSQGSGKGNPWGRSFKVKWLCLNHLPFQKTLHLKNPLNDYKPVKISRDCQELPQDIGEALCELLDVSNDVDVLLKRDDLASKRPCLEPPYSLGDQDYSVPPLHVPWPGTPMPYNPFFYQHQADPNRFHLTHPYTLATEYFPTSMGASKVASMKNSRINRNLTNLQINHDMSTQFDAWGLCAESPLASTLTEDDFLEMTYEEYLEAHGRTSKQLCRPVSVMIPSPTVQESTSGKHGDDSNSSLVTDRRHSRKRTHNSS
ncbi:uncharacterized protein LOC105792151 isoform X1 [Gossypium raimondii]|uniref:YTH domain-containing family protein n=1 Tax=Gossypium raimondii TaxID=29730 RepID=A0A0D2R148_GOSRA|nr:uncharacterized protein LOC105792151 isoform X1 [Gossypium raimondii]XP_052490935.1 uncharacterized protein LOC105792151 isoform X1 [Gossypium raimondii]KJB25709.1 hypothetical protein B456_004G205800 [Gossypium raimondii]